MFLVPHGLCRVFPALARKCVAGSSRGPAPPVALESKAGALTAWTRVGNVVLAYAAPAPGSDGAPVVLMAVLVAAVDAAELLATLPGLPVAGDDERPVTLDLGLVVVVRARDATTGETGEFWLGRSRPVPSPARVVIDRRALALGCLTARVAPGRLVAFAGTDKLLVAVALDPALAVGPADAAIADATSAPHRQRRRPRLRRSREEDPREAQDEWARLRRPARPGRRRPA